MLASLLPMIISRESCRTTGTYRRSSPQIGQIKIVNAISAEGVAENGEQCRILANGQPLAFAEDIVHRRKIECDHANFTKVVSHIIVLVNEGSEGGHLMQIVLPEDAEQKSKGTTGDKSGDK